VSRRAFGLVALICGVIVVAFGMRVVGHNPTNMGGLFVAVGVFDIIIGSLGVLR
jgi:hypothetical protein